MAKQGGGIPLIIPGGFINGLKSSFLSTTQVNLGVGKCRDSADSSNIVNASLLPCNSAINGAGGLDVGSLTANTWLAHFIIKDSTGVNAVNTLLSLSDTAPTMPGTHDLFRRVCWVRVGALGTILDYIQTGESNAREIEYLEEDGVTDVISGGNATIFSPIDFSDYLPSGCVHVNCLFKMTTDNHNNYYRFRPTGSTLVDPMRQFNFLDNNTGRVGREPNWLLTNSSQNIEYETTQSTDSLDLSIMGYKDNL